MTLQPITQRPTLPNGTPDPYAWVPDPLEVVECRLRSAKRHERQLRADAKDWRKLWRTVRQSVSAGEQMEGCGSHCDLLRLRAESATDTHRTSENLVLQRTKERDALLDPRSH